MTEDECSNWRWARVRERKKDLCMYLFYSPEQKHFMCISVILQHISFGDEKNSKTEPNFFRQKPSFLKFLVFHLLSCFVIFFFKEFSDERRIFACPTVTFSRLIIYLSEKKCDERWVFDEKWQYVFESERNTIMPKAKFTFF